MEVVFASSLCVYPVVKYSLTVFFIDKMHLYLNTVMPVVKCETDTLSMLKHVEGCLIFKPQ